nr:Dihydrofolate reductase [uncultured bacterium]
MKQPKVIAVAAISLDGKIAYDHERQIETSVEDKRYFERVTREAGTIICGRRTLDAMKRPLEGRRNVVYTTQADLLAQEPTDELWYTDEPPEQILEKLAAQGAETVAVIGGCDIFTMYADLTDEWHLTVCPIWVGEDGVAMGKFSRVRYSLFKRVPFNSDEELLILKS